MPRINGFDSRAARKALAPAPQPMLFNRHVQPVHLDGLYRGRSLFLLAGGPSFADRRRYPLAGLSAPGVLTMGLNNSPRVFRPDLWACVDKPDSFMRSIWLDPRITKFCPFAHRNKQLLDNDSAVRNGTLFQPDERWEFLPDTPGDCPNTFFYHRTGMFDLEQFFTDMQGFNWGDDGKQGRRSVLLVGLRLAHFLGFSRVFLLGVDFHMSASSTYSFDQGRLPPSVEKNRLTYASLIKRLTLMKPLMDQMGFKVWNCNPDSKLTVFPYIDYQQGLRLVQEEDMREVDYERENVSGLYDRQARPAQLSPRGE